MRIFLLFPFLLLFSTTLLSQSGIDFLPRTLLKEKATGANGNSITDSIYCYKNDEVNASLVFDFRVYNESVNKAGNVLLEITQKYQNNQWENYRKKLNNYNATGNLIDETIQYYDPEGRGWDNSKKSEFSYNINGFLTKLEYFEFANNGWQRVYRNQYDYFNNVDPDEFTQQVFQGGFWRNKFKVYYSFNGAGKITSSLFTLWDNATNMWQNNNRTFETYDNQERPINVNRETWDSSSGTWVNSSRTQWQYDATDASTKIINDEWVNHDSTWVHTGEAQLFFDENNLEIERVERNFDNEIFQNFFRSKKQYNEFNNLKQVDNELYINGLWKLISYCEYFYTQTSSAINEPDFQTKALCKIANPINSTTVIACPILEKELHLRIMNFEGKIVYDKFHTGKFLIKKSLVDGAYFFSFSKENELLETRKMIWKN